MKGLAAAGGCIEKLLPDPGGGRTGGHVQVHELTSGVADKEEDIQRTEPDGLNHERVRCPDSIRLVRQEGSPGLAGRTTGGPPAVPTDRTSASNDAHLHELASDSLRPPGWVLRSHLCDQISNIRS